MCLFVLIIVRYVCRLMRTPSDALSPDCCRITLGGQPDQRIPQGKSV